MKDDIRLYIYSDHPSTSLDISYIAENLEKYGLDIEYRGNLLDFLSPTQEDIGKLARDFSSIQITDIEKPLDITNSASGSEIEWEFNKLMGGEPVTGTVCMTDLWMQRILYRLFSEKVDG